MGSGQQVTESLLNYHRSRALGGAGMIVTEPLAIQSWHAENYKVSVFADRAEDGLRRWADVVESNDCRLLGQLQDSGRGRHEAGKHPYAIGPSVLPDDLSWVVPRALSHDEIEQLIERFALAAKRLQQAGFSGVEISAAHGHLFHQFLSPWSNLREDDWGGSVENRARIVSELVQQIRAQCGASFVIGIKLPGDDGIVNSIDASEAARITTVLSESGDASYLCYAQGSHSLRLDMHLPDMHGPRVPFLDLFRQIKPSAGDTPTIALGLITDPAEAERIISDGDSELVGLGRPLVADAAWPNKAQRGAAADIRYCVSCNSCWATIVRDGKPIACDNNPRLGLADEVDWWPQAAKRKKRIVLVGSGVAALEAGWVAAARGHDVTLLARHEQMGGKTWLQAQLPGGENLSSVYDYQLHVAQRAGLKIATLGDITVDKILSYGADHVILATGGEMLWPRQLPQELREDGFVPDLREAMVMLMPYQSRQEGTAVIYDQDHSAGTYMAASRLCELFDRVVIVTQRETVAQEEALVTRQGIYRRLNELGVEILPFSEFGDVSELEDGVVKIRNVYTDKQTAIGELALMTYSTPRRPLNDLAGLLAEHGVKADLIGDCFMPGSLREATAGAHAAANEL